MSLRRRREPAFPLCDICDGHHGPNQHPKPEGVEVAVMRCNGCGRFGVAIDSTRITAHKCGGGWTFVHQEHVPTEEVVAALKPALQKAKESSDG